VGEALNETDSQGYGMKVNARYWLDIFDLQYGQSSQREIQNAIDKPLTYFFAGLEPGQIEDNKEIFAPSSSRNAQISEAFSSVADFDKFARVVFFPLGRNKILVRLENSADKFDFYAPTLQLNMETFAKSFWSWANGNIEVEIESEIYEMDLTANMFEKEVVEMRKRVHWRGVDDEEIAEKLAMNPELKAVYEREHLDDPLTAITLVPQEMRTFAIYYKMHGEETIV
jgi:hypothetical protein